MEDKLPGLPKEWVWAMLDEISEINPKLPFQSIPEDLEVSFLPLSSSTRRPG
jgi:hypothetical protein